MLHCRRERSLLLNNQYWSACARVAALSLLGLVQVVPPAQAQQTLRPELANRSGYTAGQWALLPQWCRFTQDNPDAWRAGIPWDRYPGADHWIGLLGPDMLHLHHYCRGMRAELMRDSIADLSPRERRTLNEVVVSEMNYVIKACKADMPLMPEVLLRKGDALLRMDDMVAAKDSYEAARRLRPDYWPAYDRWIGVLIKLKQFATARRLAEEGLTHAPDQPVLQARLKEAKAHEGRSPNRAGPEASAP